METYLSKYFFHPRILFLFRLRSARGTSLDAPRASNFKGLFQKTRTRLTFAFAHAASNLFDARADVKGPHMRG